LGATSYVERQSLTTGMLMRWFTRLNSALSRKVENHAAAVALPRSSQLNSGVISRVTEPIISNLFGGVW